MAITVGPIGSAPAPASAAVNDRRIDLTTGTIWRNNGTTWTADERVRDDVLAALLASSSSQVGLARGVVVIAADQTNPPAGTPTSGVVVFKRTS